MNRARLWMLRFGFLGAFVGLMMLATTSAAALAIKGPGSETFAADLSSKLSADYSPDARTTTFQPLSPDIVNAVERDAKTEAAFPGPGSATPAPASKAGPQNPPTSVATQPLSGSATAQPTASVTASSATAVPTAGRGSTTTPGATATTAPATSVPPTSTPRPVIGAGSATPQPAETPIPTKTPAPDPTEKPDPKPTETPQPTKTPPPTFTPVPTRTPRPEPTRKPIDLNPLPSATPIACVWTPLLDVCL